jgi:hypothetical protein
VRELVRKVKNRLREASGSSGLPGIRAEPATLEAGALRLVSLAVVPDENGASPGGPAIARLLDEEDDLRELDALELPIDAEICPDGPHLFAVADGRPRALRVEIVGSGAAGWRLSPEKETIETFDDRLQGYEEWYARRHEFYGRDYFEGEGEGASGYEAGSLEQAYRAQSVFVDAVLSEAPFRSSVEFGCAAGAMVRALRARGIEARGYDLSDYAVSRAPAELKDHVHVGDFSALERMEPVEAVIGQEVFEHIPPQEVGPVFRAIHGIASR